MRRFAQLNKDLVPRWELRLWNAVTTVAAVSIMTILHRALRDYSHPRILDYHPDLSFYKSIYGWLLYSPVCYSTRLAPFRVPAINWTLAR